MLYYYLCAVFTLISATVSFGFSMEAYIKAKQAKNSALINAKYAVSRSFSLFLIAIGLLLFKSDSYLIVLSSIMICVQLFDGIIGIKLSVFKTVGPLATAIGNTILLILFLLN
ncbi:hypothetical protein [Listeria booriae]|uniref:hypothetical protein n=1 Tax=Listeria booriae TaxID=1552123 RepID=UPI00289D4CC7|nr:hypothetical protein [Listeria booriae]